MELENAGPPPGEPPKDLEPRPKVQVVFVGFEHDQFNLQTINTIAENMVGLAYQIPGRKIAYIEFADFSREEAGRLKSRFKKDGPTNALLGLSLSAELGRPPFKWEIINRAQQIAGANLDTILEKKLIPRNEVLFYFLMQALEHIQDLEIEFESHSGSMIKAVRNLAKVASTYYDRMAASWVNGKFDDALTNCRLETEMFSSCSREREKEMGPDLRKIIQQLLRERDGGILFILLGSGHFPIVNSLQKSSKTGSSVEFLMNIINPDSPPYIIATGLHNKNDVADEVYSQSILYDIIVNFIGKPFLEKKNLALFAKSHEIINKDVAKFAKSLSLSEIRRICEERQDIGELLRNHPLAQPIRQWLEF